MKYGLEITQLESTEAAVPFAFALDRIEAPAHFFASEPWFLKLAPAVLITLSLGTFPRTNVGERRYTVKEKNRYTVSSVGCNDV